MMKKKILPILFIAFCFCSSLQATWEGNGGIGAASDFPASGLFVKSDMFPKHTLLEITNLEKNVSARAVVVGSSGVPGLLAVLSPDLGNKLSVPSGKVVRIRVLTPSPVQEIGDDGLSLDVKDTIAAAPVPPRREDANKAPALKKEEPKREKEQDITAFEPPPRIVSPVAERIRQASQPSLQETERPVRQVAAPAVTAYMEPADERPPITVPRIVRPKKSEPKEDTRAVREVKAPVKPEPAAEPKPEPVQSISAPKEPEKETVEPEPEVSVIGGVMEPEAQEDPTEPEVRTVPAIQEPPAVQDIPKEEPKKEEPKKEEPLEEEVYEAVPAQTEKPKQEEKLIAKVEPEKEVPPPVFNAKLEKGKLYVQIAIYTDKNSSDSVVNRYGSQYPLLIEESKVGGKKRYTVFVGPLQTDETGAVVERFKKLGFKDPFLKRGK